ncbi:uncharacterized protein K452DRAFT_342158 [Aplosporella prunicola CBS 121167]|uniref:F-box domain-containing protein n=1 Tax=Aplosporella prunicola CBS 121167 TaxID=1176127 RepID=A0A6A6BMU9_9PEZI|nr:uncharacterized protein K452DRAFT_342158 [Aplosporella prunicola CBS 121167]KAF2145396.1 hypothetical protein K452DRAFT_342158 [Aplosporella prunicola CBS 121167]
MKRVRRLNPGSQPVDRAASLIVPIPTMDDTTTDSPIRGIYKLPIEITQEIAGYLSDQDVCALGASCRHFKLIIDDNSFWFKRFHATFDPSSIYIVKSGVTNAEDVKDKLKLLYQDRQKRLRGTAFMTGEFRSREKRVIRLLAELIRESYNGKPLFDSNGLLTCNNIEVLKEYAKNTELLEIFSPSKYSQKYNSGLAAIQLMCTSMCFDADLGLHNWNFNLSQKYCYMTAIEAPVFTNADKTMVNVEWLLHVVNFFKYHATNEDERTLFEPFQSLDTLEKPAMWTRSVKDNGGKLGKNWKGTYAYLDRDQMRLMRRAIEDDDDSMVIIDHNIDHGEKAIQTLELDYPGDHPRFKWPTKFEDSLGSRSVEYPPTPVQHNINNTNPPPKNTTAIFFEGEGYDNEEYLAAGWLNPLPEQEGIPGWMRVTMMKYFDDQQGGWHTNALWAYEGVVLPGGHIMLGRWWNPEEPAPGVYVGPFIFWDVDASVGDDDDSDMTDSEH